jgi:hypothetical protein
MRFVSPPASRPRSARGTLAVGCSIAALLLSLPAGRASAASPADSVATERPRSWPVPAPGADKFQHGTLSLTLGIGIGIGIASRSTPLALTGAIAFGVAKELRDRHHTRFDFLDLAADLAGASLAAGITSAILR